MTEPPGGRLVNGAQLAGALRSCAYAIEVVATSPQAKTRHVTRTLTVGVVGFVFEVRSKGKSKLIVHLSKIAHKAQSRRNHRRQTCFSPIGNKTEKCCTCESRPESRKPVPA